MNPPAVVRADEGRRISRPSTGGSVTVKVASRSATVYETTRPTGDVGGPALHSHPAFDETFYVLDGEWTFEASGHTVYARMGDVVHIPRGVFHSFRNGGAAPGRLLVIATPGGIERFFEEAERARDDVAAGRNCGIDFAWGPSTPHS